MGQLRITDHWLVRRLLVWAIVVSCFAVFSSQCDAATYAEQKSLIAKAGRDLRTAERFADSGKNDEAIKSYTEAANALREAGSGLDDRLKRAHERAVASLQRSHEKISAKGVALPKLETLSPTMAGGEGVALAGGAPGDQVSFTSEIAPMLVQFCGKCHVDGRKGQFSMKSYNDLLQGSKSGKVIENGAGSESLIVQVIAGGSMPPAGDPPSPQQTARLVRWINQGAQFDGDDANKLLREIKPGDGAPSPAPAPAAVPMPDAPKVTMPSGDETVSFALDVAPILTESCLGCHNQGQSRAGLSVTAFAELLKGGDSGPMIVPGKADASLLVQKIRGTAAEGDRMPLNRPPLSDDQSNLISTWIDEGAAFDGDDPTLPLVRVASLVRAARSTPEELAQLRRAAAERDWRLALPDERAEQVANDVFQIVGNVPESQLQELLTVGIGELAGVQKFLDAEGDAWLKGPLTIYAFPNRIDYAEYCTMVEQRETDRDDVGHARYDIVEPYIAMVLDNEDAERRDAMLCELLGNIAAAHRGRGGLPDWFVAGSGRAAAAKLHGRSPLVSEWKDKSATVIASVRNPSDLLDGSLAKSTRDIVAMAYIEDIRAKRGNYDKLVAAVAEGKSFDEAVQLVYRINAKQLTEAWFKSRQR